MARVEIIEQKGHNFLWIDDRLWMWDVPEEIEDQKEIAAAAFGDVLVAGYGLGVVQRFLVENDKVASVLTAEHLEDVLSVCKNTFGGLYGDVVISDFYKLETLKKFDCIIGDIWIDQGERYIDDYEKFKDKAQTLLKPDGKILGWGADYMEYLLEQRQNGDKKNF
jgi:spermidine synthase